jgi:predicted deacylase
MSADASLMSCSIPFDQDGLHKGVIRLPHSVHRSAYGHIPIPIAVAKNGHGPTVLLTGGVHGDEYEGPVVLSRLIADLDIGRLTGRIIVVPAVNYPAFVAGSRVSPIDDINLNRTFPGKRNGTATEMIAHYVTTRLLPLADMVLDFHSGGSSLSYLPCVLAPRWEDPAMIQRLEKLLEAVGSPRVVYFNSLRALSGEDRVIGNYANQNGAFYLTGEFGGSGVVSMDGVAIAERALLGTLSHLGVLSPKAALPEPAGTLRLSADHPDLYAFAPCSGFFEPRYRLGDDITAGQLAGVIHSVEMPWAAPIPVAFQRDGHAICVRAMAAVQPGDCLGHLAEPVA